jgi:hypothetical protein
VSNEQSQSDSDKSSVPSAGTPSGGTSSTTTTPSGRGVQLMRSLAGSGYEVQKKSLEPGQGDNSETVHAAAARGTSSGGGALPFGDKIQAAFGAHDVSGVEAHTGPAAADASKKMGADAYATGNHVAFGKAPDLHTAAHEAAHVVQQQAGVSLAGGVGKSNDAYEQHADKVADAVVQGKSAEGLLSQMSGGGGRSVQRKVSREGAVQMSGGSPPTGPVRTAETPAATDVPGGAEAVAAANTASSGATTPQPQVAWRKVVDRGRVAWYVVLEPVTSTTTPAPTSGAVTDIHPDQAFSLAQNPAAEAAADTFEQAVGNHACNDAAAKGAAAALGNKAVAMADAYLAAMKKASATQAQMDQSFVAILGGSGPTWAGSAAVADPAATDKAALAEANVARIRAVAASGNLREMVNLGVSFMYQFGNAALTDLAAKTVDIETFYTEAEARRGELTTGNTDFVAHLEKQITERKADTRWLGVVEDNKTVSDGQNSSRTKANTPDDQSQRTVGSLGEYAALSENEKLVMFGESAAKEKSVKDRHLTWSEGRKVWFINEADGFVQKCRDASVPMGGGISGTTSRIMTLSNAFQTGESAVNMRAAAIGYLLPIRAHTLIEVMKGAEPYGAGAVASPPSFAIYANIAPFGDLSALHPNATFTKLVQQTQKKEE